jgi:tRNA pseudouridine(38-40) synthase
MDGEGMEWEDDEGAGLVGEEEEEEEGEGERGKEEGEREKVASPPLSNPRTARFKGTPLNYPQPDLSALRQCFRSRLRGYRASSRQLERLGRTLRKYVGTHKFHNFSIRMSFRSGSVKRYIMAVEMGDPVVVGEDGGEDSGLEWVCVTLTGQAFLLHQIRKMVAVAIMVGSG